MKKSELRAEYEKRKQEFSALLEDTNNTINLISNLRLAAALAFLVVVYFSFQTPNLASLAALLVVAFLYLVKKHAILFDKKTHLENLVAINASESKVLDGNFNHLAPGDQFIDPRHAYSHDLDIFGHGSLYQYLNRCNTHGGQNRLASLLTHPASDNTVIMENQEATRELAGKIDFRQHFQAAGMESSEDKGDAAQLLSWLKQPPFLPEGKWFATILIVVPALTLLALAATIFLPVAKIVLFPLIITQWIFTGIYLKKINVFHDYISRKKNILKKYSQLLLYLEKESFTAQKLKTLAHSAHEAHENVIKLASLVSALDARTNALMTIFVNSLLMYDLQCVYRLEKWKLKNAVRLPLWIETISEAEVLNSFGTFYHNNPDFVFSNVTDRREIVASEMAHPLLSAEERVGNSLTLGPDPSIAIITGANMAGKSTFLRTLGINMVLALNGAPLCAKRFSTGIFELRSGMRTADSLQDHQSYFFAELNRLKSIMDDLRSGKQLLVLLDEILKGTNSNDKQAGSIALVRQLLPYASLTIIATHDLALGGLEDEYPGKVVNYSFEANIENDQLSFDYKLKPGLAQRMNASFLMKKMGIIP
jgi:DNA mismatch repair ATPase MutS